MKTEYREDGKNRFICIEAENQTEIGYTYRMASGNRIHGLLSFRIVREDTGMYYEYQITGLRSLTEWITKDTEISSLFSLFSAISRIGDMIQDYLLIPDELQLTPELIFVKPETGQFRFCYSPGKQSDYRQSLQSLSEFLMKTLEPADEQEVLKLYGLYQKSRDPECSLQSFLEFWKEQEKTEKSEEVPFEVVENDSLYYQALGIEKKPVKNLFTSWQHKKQTEKKAEPPLEPNLLQEGGKLLTDRQDKVEGQVNQSHVFYEDSFYDEDDMEEKDTALSGIYLFFRKHLVEISLGCGAAAAALAILITV